MCVSVGRPRRGGGVGGRRWDQEKTLFTVQRDWWILEQNATWERRAWPRGGVAGKSRLSLALFFYERARFFLPVCGRLKIFVAFFRFEPPLGQTHGHTLTHSVCNYLFSSLLAVTVGHRNEQQTWEIKIVEEKFPVDHVLRVWGAFLPWILRRDWVIFFSVWGIKINMESVNQFSCQFLLMTFWG